MSTPTTATATLPHFSPHMYPFSHHQSYSHQSNASAFRSAANAGLPASSRLAPYSASTYSSASSSSSAAASNGVAVSYASTTQYPTRPDAPSSSHRGDSSYSASKMPTSQSRQTPTNSGRKRRRSQPVDWDEFYRNGLPSEIIVIDDTPEPPTAASSHTANGYSSVPATKGVYSGTTAGDSHVSKRRRRDGDQGHYDPVHGSYVGSNTDTPPSASRISSERTHSVINTTAASSLGSLSSSKQYDYDAHTGQKRKRTTRAQLADEARRREAGALGNAHIDYQPPPMPPKKAADVQVKVIADHSYNKLVKVDDDDGHYIVVPDADLTDRYQMIKLLGQGTFGKVVQARDRRRNKLVAIKIIRSVQKYRDASRVELRVLATLKANDEENRNRCIHLRDCFDVRGHICIVMDLLGQSVFDFLKSNSFVPFPNSQIQSFARQLFTSVAFLHDLNLIHTDLKPENILLCSNEYQTFTYNRKIPSSSETINRTAKQRRVLLDTEIRLIDFGSATFQDEYHSSVVSTRHYRAPEIILGLGWSYPCDIWSIGCILVEFFTGDALFQTHDNLEHLAMMEMVVGSRIDGHLVTAVNRTTRTSNNQAAKFFKRLKLDYPSAETTRASKRFVKAMKRLDDIIPVNNRFMKLFLDLLRKIFVYDPQHRITAREALQHPWFREIAHPDDGSEAAKIRESKLRQLEMRGHGTHVS